MWALDGLQLAKTLASGFVLHRAHGVRRVEINWLKSYIENRKQFVQIGDNNSTYLDITCVVPQGSILGP